MLCYATSRLCTYTTYSVRMRIWAKNRLIYIQVFACPTGDRFKVCFMDFFVFLILKDQRFAQSLELKRAVGSPHL